LIDGTEFDSSYKRGKPAVFAPNQVIKGWTEAMQVLNPLFIQLSNTLLQLMKEGDKWQLFIPSELAYGESQRGQYITPGAVLLFDIEILKVKSGGFVKNEL
jgi:FKBP-type peptidyl-prolyl cis-trans isomerase FklB